ncbi:related to cornifin B [Fusarium fujikuroi]|nr:related to cornifin B [Fusarium fujikuroi]
MRYTEIVVLAIGNLAAAQLTTRFPDTIASAIESSTLATGTEVPDAVGGIGTPDGFNFLGCFSSENGFPGFTQVYSSVDNDADLCAETCLGANFFGLYDKKCYCGSELNLITSPSVSADQCDIACPGDADVSCGGLAAGSRVIQRQVDISVLLSIYIAVGVSPGETDTAVKTDFGTET